jgi:hypothetical protein
LQPNLKQSRWNKAVRRFYCKPAGIKPPVCRVIAFSWTGVFLRLGGFILRYFYGGFILNLAAVKLEALHKKLGGGKQF